MNLDIDQLKTLLAVIDAGSFDDASIDLGITPSAVSQRIKALENRVGSILLVRSRPVAPTAQGQSILRYARQIAVLSTEFQREITQEGSLQIAIAVNADSLATWFAPVFGQLAAWPDASCEILRTDENRTLELLRTGRVSAAITNTAEVTQGCTSRRLGTMRYRAVVGEASHSAGGPDPTAQTLADMPLLAFDRDDPLQQRMLTSLGIETTQQKPKISYVPDSWQYVHAIREGVGWGMVPEQQLRRVQGLHVLHPDWFIDVPLYLQRWAVNSQTLDRVEDIVVTAAHQQGIHLLP